MNEEQLKSIILPRAIVSLKEKDFYGVVEFRFEQNTNNIWYLRGELENGNEVFSDTNLLPQEVVTDILEEVMDADQYCQMEEFKEELRILAYRVSAKAMDVSTMETPVNTVIELEPYILQQHAISGKGEAIFLKLASSSNEEIKIPEEFLVKPPQNFIPDRIAEESLYQRIYEQVPAITLVGPTGSGKSALASYVASQLISHNWGTYLIDASARLGGDRLFERDDFNASGTFLLEGFLLKAVRKAKESDIKLLVIVEEYNTLSDETRREFYRLFTAEERMYKVQSPKPIMTDAGKTIRCVDFSHTCFILTMNPVKERYLTDDIKRLSNAETRRMAVIHLEYEKDPKIVSKILRAIITAKPSYRKLSTEISDLDNRIAYKLGVGLFLALSDRKDPLGYDVGYSSVADAIWTAALRSHRRESYCIGISEHILNGITDPQTRELAVKRIQQATGIAV